MLNKALLAGKLALLAMVNEAEEQLVGEKMGPQRKAWALAQAKAILRNAGVYGNKFFGFSFDPVLDAALDAAIEWAVKKLKVGFDKLEKL